MSCVWLVVIPACGCLSTAVCECSCGALVEAHSVQMPAASWQNSGTSVCVLSDDRGCPPGQEFVMCANQCPQRCSDLQQGIECQTNSECQPGCRCPQGTQAAAIFLTVTPHMCACFCLKSSSPGTKLFCALHRENSFTSRNGFVITPLSSLGFGVLRIYKFLEPRIPNMCTGPPRYLHTADSA